MNIPDINQEYANFILNYAKKDGLTSLVKGLDLNEEEDLLQADLQPDLIQAFADKFPDTDLKELDETVKWILIMSIARQKENREWQKKLH